MTLQLDPGRMPTPTADLPAAVIRQLRIACGGALHVPGDPGYDSARGAWQANIDQRPVAVAYPANADEVAAVVSVAAAAGLRVAPQSTGHNAAPLPPLDRTVLLRTSAMSEVQIDAKACRARVGSGTLWGDVVAAAAAAGLAALHGSSPDVGVAGYSLGGGMGWYARKLGLQTNSITAVELVTADGAIVRADRHEHADLFWAIRGGGGNFGVVTALEFDLYPIESAYAGWLVWDWTLAPTVLRAWLDWTRDCPDEVTTSFRILQLPPIEDVPPPLRGRQIAAIDGAILADDEHAAELLAPLRALDPEMDMFTRTPAPALSRLHGDPETPTPAISDSVLIGDSATADPSFVDAFVGAAGAQSGSSLMLAELRQLGGALGRPDPRAGALPLLDGAFVLLGLGVPMAAEQAPTITEHAGRLVSACSPWSSGRTYLNFTEHPTSAAAAYGDAFDRLVRVRRQYDPDGVFVANHPITSD